MEWVALFAWPAIAFVALGWMGWGALRRKEERPDVSDVETAKAEDEDLESILKRVEATLDEVNSELDLIEMHRSKPSDINAEVRKAVIRQMYAQRNRRRRIVNMRPHPSHKLHA